MKDALLEIVSEGHFSFKNPFKRPETAVIIGHRRTSARNTNKAFRLSNEAQ